MRRSCKLLSQISQKFEAAKYCPTQVSMMTEECIAVNAEDVAIRSVSKADAHRADSLVLHRAFSVFAFTPDRRLILQKRSDEKITFPGLWTNTCCSHPLSNEREMDGTIGAKRAAVRKLQHELGIEGVEVDEMTMAGRFHYQAVMKEGEWGEHEMDYALILPSMSIDRITINENEVSQIKEVSHEELIRWVKKEPSSFTPWMKLFIGSERLTRWWNNLDNLKNVEDFRIHRMN